jgi:hypothetical protein
MNLTQNDTLLAPTEELVRAACDEFDQDPDNLIIERSLAELFTRYPANSDHAQVFLKVVTLNTLYSTWMPLYSSTRPDLRDMAQHIHENAEQIDAALAAGSPEIVDTIASPKVPGKRDYYYFSFASKYCSWHRPESYPIYDSNVDRYISCLKNEALFREFFNTGENHWRYSEFRRLISILRERHSLNSCSFKQFDKFLYLHGGRL